MLAMDKIGMKGTFPPGRLCSFMADLGKKGREKRWLDNSLSSVRTEHTSLDNLEGQKVIWILATETSWQLTLLRAFRLLPFKWEGHHKARQ